MSGFNTMGDTLASTRAELHIEDPYDMPLYAHKREDGTWELTDEVNENPSVFICVGQDSPEFRARKKANFKLVRDIKDYDRAEEEAFLTVAAGIVGWKNVIWDGLQLPFNTENCVEVLDKYRPSFDQADAFIIRRRNFFTKASKA